MTAVGSQVSRTIQPTLPTTLPQKRTLKTAVVGTKALLKKPKCTTPLAPQRCQPAHMFGRLQTIVMASVGAIALGALGAYGTPIATTPIPDQIVPTGGSVTQLTLDPAVLFSDPDGYPMVLRVRYNHSLTSMTLEYPLFSTVTYPTTPMDILVDGTTMYVANYFSGLSVTNIANSTAPKTISTLNTPGQALALQKQGGTLYIADGPAGLALVNVAIPSAPTIISQLDTPGIASDVTVQGNFAFVADGNSGVQVINITTPTALTLQTSFLTTDAQGITITGQIAVIADGAAGIKLLNIQNPSAPTLISGYNTNGYANAVFIDNNIAYVADDTNGIVMIDISTPATPTLLGTWPSKGATKKILKEGSLIYAADYSGKLRVIDVTNPASATEVGYFNNIWNAESVAVSPTTIFVGSTYAQISLLDKQKRILYLTAGVADVGNHLVTIEASDLHSGWTPTNFTMIVPWGPLSITPLQDKQYPSGQAFSLTIPANAFQDPNNDPIFMKASLKNGSLPSWLTFNNITRTFTGNPITVNEGDYAIKVVAWDPSMQSIDAYFHISIVNPAGLTVSIIGSIANQTAFSGQPFSLNISAIDYFHQYGNGELKLTLTAINTHTLPNWMQNTIQPKLMSSISNGPFYAVKSLDAQDGILAFAGPPNLGLCSVTNPFAPTCNVNQPYYGDQSILLDKNLLYTASGLYLTLYDISNLANPNLLHSPGGTGTPSSIILSDKYLTVLVADPNHYGFWIFNPELNESRGRVSNQIDIPQYGYSRGELLYITEATQGLNIFDVNLPTGYKLLSQYRPTGQTYGIDYRNDLLYISGSYGVKILNASNPSSPIVLGAFNQSSSNLHLKLAYPYALVSDSSNGIYIVDVSDPTNLRKVGKYDTPGQSYMSDYDSGFIYVADGSSGVQILQANLDKLHFSAIPANADGGDYQFVLTAYNNYGGTASIPFKLTVQSPPYYNTTISNKIINVNVPFTYIVPTTTFADKNNDALYYSVGNLPSWLFFSNTTRQFSGTPLDANRGVYPIALTASDHIAGAVTANFNIAVGQAPFVSNPIPNQPVNIGAAYSYTFAANTFVDPNNYAMSYSAKQSNGLPLPSWLTFNSASRQFTGTPPQIALGVLNVQITADNGNLGTTTDTFQLNIQHFPTSNVAISTQYADVGAPFSFTIPSAAFADADGDTLVYSATLADGSPLPSWLALNGSNGTFSGTPQQANVGNVAIKVTAFDGHGGTASTTFTINISHFPKVAHAIANQAANINTPFIYPLPSTTFSDADGDPLTISASLANGNPLQPWLDFNQATQTFSGVPNANNVGTQNIQVSASDGKAIVSTTFLLVVGNHPPVLNTPIGLIGANINKPFSFKVPAGTFSDPDGQTLSYTLTQADGTPIPAWMSFNPSNQTLSGTPTPANAGSLSLKLIADDGFGGTVSDTFTLQAGQFPIVSHQIPLQHAKIGRNYTYPIPSNAFSDPNNYPLTLSVTGMPTWLSFNGTSLKGTPTGNQTGTSSLLATANNGNGGTVTTVFSLQVDHNPVLNAPIPNQSIKAADFYTYFINQNTFIDADNDPLTFSASLANGDPLPTWLQFNPRTGTFAGIPASTDAARLVMQVSANDGNQGLVAASYVLYVDNPLPPLPIVSSRVFTYTFPPSAFSAMGTAVSYSAALANGTPLPPWLVFDPSTLTFSGLPPAGLSGQTIDTTVNVTNTFRESYQKTLQLQFSQNHPPKEANPISSQKATVFSSFLSPSVKNVFTDADGDALTYSATIPDNAKSWLTFNPTSLLFSGTPRPGDTDFYQDRIVTIVLTANDGQDKATSTFNIAVGGMSSGELAIKIIAPLVSTATTLFGLYKKRALFYNLSKKYVKDNVTLTVGQPFSYPLSCDPKDVREVESSIISQKGLKTKLYSKIDGSKFCGKRNLKNWIALPDSLPYWLTYNETLGLLHTDGPAMCDVGTVRITAFADAGIILEQFEIHIYPTSQETEVGMIPLQELGLNPQIAFDIESEAPTAAGSDAEEVILQPLEKIPSQEELHSPLQTQETVIVASPSSRVRQMVSQYEVRADIFNKV